MKYFKLIVILFIVAVFSVNTGSDGCIFPTKGKFIVI